MRHTALIKVVLTAFLLIGLTTFADANLISNSGFESGSPTTNTTFTTAGGPYGVWMDRSNWSFQPGGPDGQYAYQDTCSNCGDQLFQAFLGDLAPAGSMLQLDFDYRFSMPLNTQGYETVKIVGIDTGDHWYPWAPDWDTELDILYTHNLSTTTGTNWSEFISPLISVSKNYAAIGVVFQFGGTIGSGEFRAVDNINVNRVPEPSTILLLGSGLVGLVGYRRRKRML